MIPWLPLATGVAGIGLAVATQSRGSRATAPGLLSVTNPDGRAFNVRVVRNGEKYGLKDGLTHDQEDPLVEFYDALYASDKPGDHFGPRGQFVSRYYLSTLAKRAPGGLLLDGGVPAWWVSAENAAAAVAFAASSLRIDLSKVKGAYTYSGSRSSDPADRAERDRWMKKESKRGRGMNRTCPSCKRENVLSAYEAARGYQCSSCTARDEGGGY